MSNGRALRRRMAAAARRHGRLDPRPAGVAALVQGRLNAYKCPACRGYTVTVDVDRGATPSMLACRATDGCQGVGFSLYYPPPQAWPAGVPATPAWEWYRPGEDELGRLRRRDPQAYEHAVRGGLLLRPYRAGHTGQPEPAGDVAAPAEQPDTGPAAVVTEADLTPPDVDVDLRAVVNDATRRAADPAFAERTGPYAR